MRSGPVFADCLVNSFAGDHPVLSATQDAAAAANASFQAAPSWLTRSNTPPANDLFGNLVSQNTPSNSSAALPPPPPQQNDAAASPPSSGDPAPANNANNSAASAGNNTACPASAGERRFQAIPPITRRHPMPAPVPPLLPMVPATALRQMGPANPPRPRRRRRAIRNPATTSPRLTPRMRLRSTQPSWRNRSAIRRPRRRRLPLWFPTSTPTTNVPATAPASGVPTAPIGHCRCRDRRQFTTACTAARAIRASHDRSRHDAHHIRQRGNDCEDGSSRNRLKRQRAGRRPNAGRCLRGNNGRGHHGARHAEDHARKDPGRRRGNQQFLDQFNID